MAMWIEVVMSDGTSVYARSSGGYAPDVMHDLQNRVAALMNHAASVNLQVVRALEHGFDDAPAVDDEPALEDEATE